MSRKSEVNYTLRLKFTGARFAADSSDDTYPRDSRYQQLVWHLEENELERQAVHHSIVHTALVFHHGSKQFYMDLQIEVKMQRWHHRFRQHLICPPRNRKALTRAKIEPAGTKAADPAFSSLAKNLNRDLIKENLYPVVEVSDPKPAVLPDDIQESDNEPESDSLSLLIEAQLALARQLTGQEPRSALTAPRSSPIIPTPTADSSSSSSTLVDPVSSNEPDDRTERKTDIPEVGDPASSGSNAVIGKVNTIQENGLVRQWLFGINEPTLTMFRMLKIYLQTRIQLSSKLASTVAQVATDQLVFAPVSTVGLFTLVQLAQPNCDNVTRRIERARDQVESTFTDVLLQNYELWPGVRMVNFFVSLQYRLLVSNTVAVFWSAYLSMNANKPTEPTEPLKMAS
ncbi:Mpv17/PMP22 family protein [Aspergillus affinis]|uniref:Mpv17/PMP22 family protein n=1 Tax=Aspergillus affinis TaxID=1070780 RepID=UPI0022FDC364|nr:uncharacterized protein KD926_005841 [Aspergillus affinis]KAI9045898.1 hypothetical protein KD926_005841 [Aspergillus affinis]